jgi:hypothetical protein
MFNSTPFPCALSWRLGHNLSRSWQRLC